MTNLYIAGNKVHCDVIIHVNVCGGFSTMKTLLIVILMTCSINAIAMRCGSSLITEGDTASKVISLCGEPTSVFDGSMVYTNFKGEGMNYILHFDNSGQVENIWFGRGSQR